MTAYRLCTRAGLLLPGLLVLLVSIVPAFARTGDYYGPLYVSSPPISEAQSVLKAEHYLPAGQSTTGQMDEPTVRALRAFQRDHFIPASGLLDHETMAQLATHEEMLKVAKAQSARPERLARTEQPGAERQAEPSAAGADSSEQRTAQRSMPETASPIPLMTGLGALLLAFGLILLWRAKI